MRVFAGERRNTREVFEPFLSAITLDAGASNSQSAVAIRVGSRMGTEVSTEVAVKVATDVAAEVADKASPQHATDAGRRGSGEGIKGGGRLRRAVAGRRLSSNERRERRVAYRHMKAPVIPPRSFQRIL